MSIPDSRLRGLIRDLTDGLAQQMYLWGRDVHHPDGNALLRSGMQRIARIDNDGEGTSLYRIERGNGWIELHGFCAGWRPHDSAKDGMLYIRRCHRILIASGQMTPGRYDMFRLRSPRGSTPTRTEPVRASCSFGYWPASDGFQRLMPRAGSYVSSTRKSAALPSAKTKLLRPS